LNRNKADHLLPSTTKMKNEVSAPIAINYKTTVFLNVLSCSTVEMYHCIKGIWSLHPPGKSGQHIPLKLYVKIHDVTSKITAVLWLI
jgi:hypothetical protein